MRFDTPLALVLLLFLPAIYVVGRSPSGRSGKQAALALATRMIVLMALILALSGFEIVRASRSLGVVFLIDASDSMPDSSTQLAEQLIQEALEEKAPEDQAAVILFGENAVVDRPMSSEATLTPLSSAPGSAQTNLTSALLLSEAIFPGNLARRIVIYSDGRETRGDSFDVAGRLSDAGIDLVLVKPETAAVAETVLQDVTIPGRLLKGELFDLVLSIQADANTPARVRIFEDDVLFAEQTLNLTRGVHAYRLPLRAEKTGFVRYRVIIDPQVDNAPQNNRMSAFTMVQGVPRILVIAPEPDETLPGSIQERGDEAGPLVAALRAASFEVEELTPGGMPADPASLSQYGAIALVDVPARDFVRSQMLALQTYVRDLGGGLLTIGGPTSFGVGGYYQTPLEEILPVSMEIQDELRMPAVTMVFLIDRSGSMAELSLGANKLELAKEAATRAVQLLHPQDRVGVVAFDETAGWVVPLQDLKETDSIVSAIGSIRSGGGTDILAGLQAVAQELPADPGDVKHIILLTDGGADPAGLAPLAEELRTQHSVTLTAVGIGQDAAPFLAELAQAGGGRYHFTAQPEAIPAIFTEETTLASRSYILEETFTPHHVNFSPILQGVEGLPPLRGYVATSGKPAAEVLLASPAGDPILATWRYGLGKAVAFTSDASGRWGRDWVPWDGFGTFWARGVRWALQESSETAIQASISNVDEQAVVEVDVRGPGGEFINHLLLEAVLVRPDLRTETLIADQQAPGSYLASFEPNQEGVYLIRINGRSTNGGEEVIGSTLGWVRSYSPEYQDETSRADLFERLVTETSARTLIGGPAGIFNHDLDAPTEVRPAAPWLLLAAILLLPVDVALRRLVLRGDEATRVSTALRQLLAPGPRPPAESSSTRSVRAFRQIKERAEQRGKAPGDPAGLGDAAEQATRAGADKSADHAPAPEGTPQESAEQTSATTAARLLAEKRRKQQNAERPEN